MSTRIAALLATLLCSSWPTFSVNAQDTPPQTPPAPETTAPAAEPEPPAEPPAQTRPSRYRREVVNFGSNAYLGKDEAAHSVVAIGGNATSEGEVREAVVSVFGKTHVTGTVDGAAVAVLGDVYVDGRVGREVVSLLGDVTLGPNAVIEGDVKAFGGTVNADPAAKVEGDIEQVSGLWDSSSYLPWFKQGLLLGRPLAFEAGFGWAWSWAAFFLLVYVIIALALPRQLTTAAATFEQRPGEIVVAAFLSLLLTPLVFIAVIATGVGLLLVPFMWLAMLFGLLFGKAAVLGVLGRRVTRLLGEGPFGHVAIAVAIGSVLMACIYAVPGLGFIAFFCVALLGIGVAVFMLIGSMRAWQGRRSDARRVDLSKRSPAGTVPPEPASIERASVEVPLYGDDMLALPRAGFWIRMGALFVDTVLVLVVVSFLGDEDLIPVALAGYGAVMWKLKGTTIGGTLCNLQVVRSDGREIDWATAIVRALSCFLSLIFAGLGFIWVAFDPERQAWHDKISGTVVVRTAKTVALV
jgi:uncharacterized RDD family membrane protein YckC